MKCDSQNWTMVDYLQGPRTTVGLLKRSHMTAPLD